MRISGLAKHSLVDYPGHVACVLFVPYCNYDCFYCHNRALIEGRESPIDPDEVLRFLQKRAGLLEGVVISGGEPTLQPDLADYIGRIRLLGCRVKLDTNGSAPVAVENLLDRGLIDYCAVDYKAPASRYEEICGRGAEAEPVLLTVRLLLACGIPFEVRTTVIPQLKKEDLEVMARELPPLPRYVLNRYRKPDQVKPGDEQRAGMQPYTRQEILDLAAGLKNIQSHIEA